MNEYPKTGSVRWCEDLTPIFVASSANIWSGSNFGLQLLDIFCLQSSLSTTRPFPPPSRHGFSFPTTNTPIQPLPLHYYVISKSNLANEFYSQNTIVKKKSSIVSRGFSRNMFGINLVFNLPRENPHKGVVLLDIDDIERFPNSVIIIFILVSSSFKCKYTNAKGMNSHCGLGHFVVFSLQWKITRRGELWFSFLINR